MTRKIHVIMVLLLILILVLAVGCGGGKTNETTAAKWNGAINIALNQDPPKLDPSASTALVDRHVFQSLFDKLIDLDEKGKLVPMLAERWEISQDGKSYTFFLRKGVKFHDGTDFNAEAVKFNIDRNLDKASVRRNELKEISKVTVVDEHTIKIELTKAFAPFLSILTDRAGMIVSPAAVKKYGQDFMSHPVGTGPFAFKERVKGSTITLEKNPNYWQKGFPKADKIVYKILTDANVALMNLKSGQVDITNRFPFNETNNFKNDAKIRMLNEPGPGFRGMVINTGKAPFNSFEVTQAIELLIDREAIAKVVLNGIGTPGRTFFSPNNFAYNANLDKPLKPDLEKVKQLLAKAGQANGFSFTLKMDSDPLFQQIGQMVQNMLKPAGIEVKLERMEFGALLEHAKTGNFEAAFIGWSGRIDPDQNIYDWFISSGSMNYMKYSNKEVDNQLNAARAELDDVKRKALYDKVSATVLQEVSYVVLYHEHNVYGLDKAVKGFTYIPDGMIRTLNLSK
jgi:peptide/nickel transport system substrate-binding protein